MSRLSVAYAPPPRGGDGHERGPMIQFLRRALRRGRRVIAGLVWSSEIAGAQPPGAIDTSAARGNSPPTPVVIASDGLPFPPPELHFLVSGNKDLDYSAFWAIGRSCADAIVRLLKKYQTD